MSAHDDDVGGGGGRGRGGRGRARGGRGGGGRGRGGGGRFGGRGHVGSRNKTDRSNSNTSSSDVANDASFDDAVIEEHYFSSIEDLQKKEPLTMTGKETEVWLKKALRIVANDDDGIGGGSCGDLPQGVPANIVLDVANTVFSTESPTAVDSDSTIVADHGKLGQSPRANRLIPSPRSNNDNNSAKNKSTQTPSRDEQTQQRGRYKNKKCSPLPKIPKKAIEPTLQGWIGTRSPSEEELLYISSYETADDKSIIDDLYDDEVVVEKIKYPPSLKEQPTTANASSTTQRQDEIPTRKEQQKLKPTADDTIVDDLYDDDVVEQFKSPPSSKQKKDGTPSKTPTRKVQQKLKQQQQKKDRSSLFCTPNKGQENNDNFQVLTGEAEQLSKGSPASDAFISPPPSSEIHVDRGGGRGGKGRRGDGGRGTTDRGPSLSKDVKPQDPSTDKVVTASATADDRTFVADYSSKIDTTTTAMKVPVPLLPEMSEKDRRVAEKKQKMAAIKERKRTEKVAKRQKSHAAEAIITDKALAEASSVPSPPESDKERLAQVIDAAVAKERKRIEESKKNDKRGSPSTVVNNPVVHLTASVPCLEDDGKELRLNQHPKSRTSGKGPLPFFEKLRQKKSPSEKGYSDVKKEDENAGSRDVIIKPTQTSPALAVSSTPSAMKSQDTHNQRKKPSVSFDTAVADRPVKANDVVDALLVESDQQLESEKERLASLLREEREKAAAAKDRKKTEKSKKHERWLKERETEKTRRGDFW